MRLLALALLCSVPALAQSPRSLALVVGDNRGLSSDEALRFAESDARQVRDTLVEVGGFQPTDVTVLTAITADDLRAQLVRLGATLDARPTERLLLYVSSHASDGALHLAGTSLPMRELVDFVKRAPVKVGLLVLDACRSGAVTKLKGLTPLHEAPTRIEATELEGRIFISASGLDEYAQESEALQGSTFTHHLLTGLRGAADASHDGVVTLDEAYAWAWARTIEATFGSRGGVQRPSFSVDLRGQGQLVLARPGEAHSRLVIAVREPGRWLVVSARTGTIVAEVDKPEGPLSLALPPGEYRVRLRTGREVLERTVTLPELGAVSIGGDDLERASFVRVATKGGPESTLVLSAGGTVSSALLSGLSAEPGAELRFRRDAFLAGPLNELTIAGAVRTATSTGASGFSQLELELRAGLGHAFTWSPVSLGVGLELGPMIIHQTKVPGAQPERTSLALTAGAYLEVRVTVMGPLQLFAGGLAGGALAKKSDALAVIPRLGASIGVGLAF